MGDITRSSFTPANHYSSVRQQQGRLWLDAEWNEQADIERHRAQVSMLDVVGADGAPADAAGFELAAAAILKAVAVSGTSVTVAGEAATILQGTLSLAGTASASDWTRASAPSGVTGSLNAVASIGSADGWLVGDGAAIVRWSDGDAAIQSPPSTVTADLYGVTAVDGTHAFAVGDGATILATTNGTSWVTQTAPTGIAGALRAVDFISDTAGWAVGDSAQIIATTDGGATWTTQTTPAAIESDLNGVWFGDADHGCAVGDGATLLTTTDGGQTWTVQTPPDGVTADLVAVSGLGTEELWAVGSGATMLHSADGGQTWTSLLAPFGLTPDLTGVAAIQANQAIAVGDLSSVWVLPVQASAGGQEAVLQPLVQVEQNLPAGAPDLSVSSGRLYVDGILIENERTVRFTAQPDLLGMALETGAGTYLAYLDVWERELTAVERPDLREVALGGPDTTTRLKTIWQAKLAPAPAGATCASFGSDWTPDDSAPARMSARAVPAVAPASDCMVPEGGGFQRLENQLYRVEVHTGGPIGTATFKWSRDNASMLSTLEAIDDTTSQLTVASAGPDDVLGFASAALVELSDEQRVLSGESGELLPVQSVLQTTITWGTLTGPAPQMSDFAPAATVRRWDGQLTGVAADTWTTLESGVQVRFTDGEYGVGDYWLIPARTLTATIDWPQDGELPAFAPPAGIAHHYCPLGLVTLEQGGLWNVASDCRLVFPSLTEMTRFFHVGGDGQEQNATNGQALPEPLEVGVMNGTAPVVGAPVQFTVVSGTGQLADVGATTLGGAGPLIVETNAEGIAACSWTLTTTPAAQQVEARLLGPGQTQTQHVPLHFNAQVIAVSGGQGVCTVVAMPGDDLQAAADALITAGGGELCLAAGTYAPAAPVIFDSTAAPAPVSVTVTGRGSATQVTCSSAPEVLVFQSCADVVVRGVSVTAGPAPQPTQPPPPAPAPPGPPVSQPVAPISAPVAPLGGPISEPIKPIAAEAAEAAIQSASLESEAAGPELATGLSGAISIGKVTSTVTGVVGAGGIVGIGGTAPITGVIGAGGTTGGTSGGATGGTTGGATGGVTGTVGSGISDVNRVATLRSGILSNVTAIGQITAGSGILTGLFPPKGIGGVVQATPFPPLPGAIATSGCASVKVLDCVVTCPDGSTTVQAGVSVLAGAATTPASGPGEALVERTRCMTGNNQVGVFISGATVANVPSNHVQLIPGTTALIPFGGQLTEVAPELTAQLTAAVQPQSAATTQMQIGSQTLNIAQTSATAALWQQFAQSPQAAAVQAPADVDTQLTSFVQSLATTSTAATTSAVNTILLNMRAIGRGVVVLGSAFVQAEGNVIDTAACGIFVIGQNASGPPVVSSGEVAISRNFINLLVPRTVTTNSCAVYVESAGRVTVENTMATVARWLLGVGTGDVTGVSGIVINGSQGPFLIVQQTSTDGFAVGVDIESPLPPPTAAGAVPAIAWTVANTMATSTGANGSAVTAPVGTALGNNVFTV
jgi:photosystem II stability/assembly factor-like uncharacterized protein